MDRVRKKGSEGIFKIASSLSEVFSVAKPHFRNASAFKNRRRCSDLSSQLFLLPIRRGTELEPWMHDRPDDPEPPGGQRFAQRLDVILPQGHAHGVERLVLDAVAGRDDVPVGHEDAAALAFADADQGRPREVGEAGGLAIEDAPGGDEGVGTAALTVVHHGTPVA